jgi:hypothetical protein
MAALYADEDFSLPVVEQLRRFGHDVLTAQDAGQADQGIADDLVLSYASSCGRAVLSFNRRHFIKLHGQGIPHAGIIVCTRDPDIPGLAARIDQAIAACASLQNALIRIIRPPHP